MLTLALLVGLLAGQLATLQQPSPAAPPGEPAQPSPLVAAADAAKAQQATRERIAALTREAEVLKRQSASVLDELRKLEVERNLQLAREAQARQALAVLGGELAALTSRQGELQDTLDRERPAVAARLRRLQRLGRVGYARIAWNAESAQAVGRAARLMTYLAHDDGRRLAAYRQTSDDLARTQAQVAARERDARALQAEARTRRQAAEAAAIRKQDLLASLQLEAGERERWVAELVAARVRLDATMNASTPVAPSPVVSRVPLATRRRQLPWPVAGEVASRFGRQRDPRFGTTTVSNGITIAADAGTAVRAVHPGTVVFAGTFTGFGQLVIVDHGQHAYSLYGYLSLVGVQRGATVEAGTVVGQVGDAPDGRGGLYLEVRIDGRPVNPLEWLSRAQ
ncbi:murein hydrolase activator EnvC family protein [Luteitalea sp.]|uniref:murein hydrolase activator EnvC family protein n=1 Tax=Luteitalea sp. TaxID=2004800 RepID=UPI0037C893DD